MSATITINHGRVEPQRLRHTLASLPLPRTGDGRIVLAVDVSPWLRPDAATSPDMAADMAGVRPVRPSRVDPPGAGRYRGVFTYVEAATQTGTPSLCRPRYVGSAHDWQVETYRASHADQQNSIFPSGLPIGTCEDALDLACGFYLDDPAAWQDLRPPTN